MPQFKYSAIRLAVGLALCLASTAWAGHREPLLKLSDLAYDGGDKADPKALFSRDGLVYTRTDRQKSVTVQVVMRLQAPQSFRAGEGVTLQADVEITVSSGPGCSGTAKIKTTQNHGELWLAGKPGQPMPAVSGFLEDSADIQVPPGGSVTRTLSVGIRYFPKEGWNEERGFVLWLYQPSAGKWWEDAQQKAPVPGDWAVNFSSRDDSVSFPFSFDLDYSFYTTDKKGNHPGGVSGSGKIIGDYEGKSERFEGPGALPSKTPPSTTPPTPTPAKTQDPREVQVEEMKRVFKLYQRVREMERKVDRVTLQLGLQERAIADLQRQILVLDRADDDKALMDDAYATVNGKLIELDQQATKLYEEQAALIKQVTEQYKELVLQAKDVLDKTESPDLRQKVKAVTGVLENQSELLTLQLYLAAGRFPMFDDEARRQLARYEQPDVVHRLQAVSLIRRGHPRSALAAIQKALEANPDDPISKQMLHDLEQGYLRAISAKTLGDGAEVRDKLEEAFMEKGRPGWLNYVKDLLSTGITTAGREIAGRGDIRGLTDLAVREMDLAAVEHTGLELILRLHQAGHTLNEIKGMPADQFAQAIRKLAGGGKDKGSGGYEVDAGTVARMQLAISKAMNNDDVLRLMNPNRQQLDADKETSYYATGAFERTWMDYAGDSLNVANAASLLPGAVIGKAGGLLGLSKEAQAMTVGSGLVSAAKLGQLATVLEKSAMGRAALQDLTRFQETGGVVSKMLAQTLIDQGIIEAGAYFGGRPGEIAAQVLTTLGLSSLDELTTALRRGNVKPADLERLLDRLQARRMAVAEARAPVAKGLAEVEAAVPLLKGGKLPAQKAVELQAAAEEMEKTVKKTQEAVSRGTTNTVLTEELHEQKTIQETLRAAAKGEQGRVEAGREYLKTIEQEVSGEAQELETTVKTVKQATERLKREAEPPGLTVKTGLDEATPGGEPRLTIRVIGGGKAPADAPAHPTKRPRATPVPELQALDADAPYSAESAAEEAVRAKKWADAETKYAVVDAQLEKQGVKPGDPRRRGVLQQMGLMREMQLLAEQQSAYKASKAAKHLAEKAINEKAVQPFEEKEIRALLEGKRLEDLEPALNGQGLETYNKPVVIKDSKGMNVAIFKPKHPELGGVDIQGEIAGYNVQRALGIKAAAVAPAKIQGAQGEVEGVLVRYVYGADLLKANRAELFHAKEVIEADKVVSALIGDADRHAGQFRLAPDGQVFAIDHGLADLPEKVFKDAPLEKAMAVRLGTARSKDVKIAFVEDHMSYEELSGLIQKADEKLAPEQLHKLLEPAFGDDKAGLEEAVRTILERKKHMRKVMQNYFLN